MTAEAFYAFLNQPLVSSALTFIGTLLAADLKRRFDLRSMRREAEETLAREELRLKALEVVGRIELLSEQRKRLGFAPTPTDAKLGTAKTELAATGAHPAAVAEAIEYVLPHAREQAKQVIAKSIPPAGNE